MNSNNIDAYVFISYSTKNLDIAESIKTELEKNEISCWMAPYSIPSGSDYSVEIFDAIANCKVFVLILSEQSMKSQYVPKELDLAIANCKIVLPFQIDDRKLEKNFAMYLANVQIYHAGSSPRDSLRRITDFIVSVSKNLSHHKTISSFPTQHMQFPNKNLVPRHDCIRSIDELFSQSNIVFISGIGGAGKSELARMYVKHEFDLHEIEKVSFNDYFKSLRLTISMMQFDNFDDDFYLSQHCNELENSNVTDALFLKKISMLKNCSKELLFVIDGLDNYFDQDIDVLMSLNCKVLVTTRCNFSNMSQIKLDVLSDKEQRDIFISYYDDYDESSDEDNIYVDKIINLVNSHTMTIMLLSLFLNVSGLSAKELYEEMTASADMYTNLNDEIEYEHNYKTIVQHISNIFVLSSLPEEEINILYKLSVLPKSGVSKKMFRWWNMDGTMTIVDKLIKKGWIHNERGIICLHPIIHSIIVNRRPLSVEFMKDYLTNIAEYLDVPIINKINLRIEAEQIAYSMAENINEESELTCYLFLKIGRYINDYNYWKFFGARNTYDYTFLYQAVNKNNDLIVQFEKAYLYLQKALEIYHNLHMNNNALISQIYSNLGNTCYNMNNVKDAIKYHSLALEGRIKDFTDYHEKVITSRRRLGTCYLTINAPEEAIIFFKKNLEAVLNMEKPDKVILSKCWFDCGRGYYADNKSANAVECFFHSSEYIGEVKAFDLFACSQMCYEIAFFLSAIGNDQKKKTLELLTYGKTCIENIDSSLADSLRKKIEEMLLSLSPKLNV